MLTYPMRIAFISDIHSNFEALQAVLAILFQVFIEECGAATDRLATVA